MTTSRRLTAPLPALFVSALLIVLVTSTMFVVGQTPDNVRIISQPDYFIVQVIAPNAIPLNDFVILVVDSDGGQQTVRLEDRFPILSIPNSLTIPGTCFVYRRENTVSVLPAACSRDAVFEQSIAPVDIFWYDDVRRQPHDIAIQSIVCPSASLQTGGCLIGFSTPVPTPTPPEPIIPHGVDNLGQPQYASLESIIEQTRIRTWHQAGWTGQGIKIGVLDRHFGGLDASGIAVTLPSGADRAAYSSDNITLGVQVLEVLHAVAPAAELYICRYDSFDDFRACVDWLLDGAQVNIINHATGVPALQLNGRGIWAAETARAAATNVVWVDAAGNFARSRWNDSFFDQNGDSLHEFAVQGYNQVLGFSAINHLSGTVMLTWGDFNGRPAGQLDLDLVVVELATGREIVTSRHRQLNAGDLPLEVVTFEMNQPFGVQIVDQSGSNTRLPFVLSVEFAGLPNAVTSGSIQSPGDSPASLTVGALQGALVAPYSSRGPVDGANKPDLLAPGEIQLASGAPFVGTSASTAIITGYTALVWQKYPEFLRQQVVEYILTQATRDDSVIRGFDNDYGQGIFEAPPLEPLWTPTLPPTATDTPIPFVTPPPSETPIPSPTLDFSAPQAVVQVDVAYLHAGPGVVYNIEGAARRGDRFLAVAQAYGWYQVEAGGSVWVVSGAVRIEPEGASVPFASTIPDLPASRTPEFTPTFLPTPTAVPGAPDEPGHPIATRTPFPPIPTGELTPVITVTPNVTETEGAIQTATQYVNDITATVTAQEPTLTQLPLDQTATATQWTNTPVPTPTVDLTRMTATPTPNFVATGAALATGTQQVRIRTQATQTAAAVPSFTPVPPSRTFTPSPTPTPAGPAPCVPSQPPGWVSYTVRAGDTVSYLASVTGTSQDEIVAVNCLASAGAIVAGQPLFLRNQPPPPTQPSPDTPTPYTPVPGEIPPPGYTPATSEPPNVSAGIASVGPVGSGSGGGCLASISVSISGISNPSGRICIRVDDGYLDCNYGISGSGLYWVEFGGIGQGHSVWVEVDGYGSAGAGGATCG